MASQLHEISKNTNSDQNPIDLGVCSYTPPCQNQYQYSQDNGWNTQNVNCCNVNFMLPTHPRGHINDEFMGINIKNNTGIWRCEMMINIWQFSINLRCHHYSQIHEITSLDVGTRKSVTVSTEMGNCIRRTVGDGGWDTGNNIVNRSYQNLNYSHFLQESDVLLQCCSLCRWLIPCSHDFTKYVAKWYLHSHGPVTCCEEDTGKISPIPWKSRLQNSIRI